MKKNMNGGSFFMDKKNHEVRVKVSLDELRIIKHKSQTIGLSVSSYLRVLGLKSNIVTT